MLRYNRCNIVILMAATAWLMLSFSSCIWKVRYTNQIRTRYRNWSTTSATQLQPSKSLRYIGYTSTWWQHDCWLKRYTNQIRTRYRNWRTTSATQLHPSNSLRYIGYTQTWSDVRSCVLMQEATTWNAFYDGISFQNLVTVLISVFTLCHGPRLLFRGPYCISR